MNQLINIVYLGTAFYFLLPLIIEKAGNAIYTKVLFVAAGVVLQLVFDILNKFITKKKMNFKKIHKMLDKPLMKSLLLLLGFMLLSDIKVSPNIINRIPGLDQVINSRIVTIIFIMTPYFLIITGKCLLRPI